MRITFTQKSMKKMRKVSLAPILLRQKYFAQTKNHIFLNIIEFVDFVQENHLKFTLKDAHIISELLGNHHLVSNFECDVCNSIFGNYESDLANFLGITRTIQSVKGKKNKIPKFPSYDNQLKAESKLDPEEEK